MSTRVVFCSHCSARYEVPRALLDEDNVVLLCSACGNAGKASAFEEVEKAPPPPPADLADGPRVIVGHEVPAAARSIAAVLKAAGMSPVLVKTGEQVLSACDPALPAHPAAVVLDVGIPGVLAFEVVEQLRAHPATRAMPVILLASVFERTRYKRKPSNLYGADAYLELHHVPDRLVVLLASLLNKTAVPDERLQAPVERARAAGLRSQPEAADLEATHALARRLLSDVVLYHGDDVAQGVRKGEPFAALGASIEAALELFLAQSSKRDVFDEELSVLRTRLMEREGGRDKGRAGGADG